MSIYALVDNEVGNIFLWPINKKYFISIITTD